jgi:hypothetical protein
MQRTRHDPALLISVVAGFMSPTSAWLCRFGRRSHNQYVGGVRRDLGIASVSPAGGRRQPYAAGKGIVCAVPDDAR